MKSLLFKTIPLDPFVDAFPTLARDLTTNAR